MKKNDIANYLNTLVLDGVFPGYQLGLIHEDQVDQFIGGYRQLYPTREPQKKGLLFDLASLTKVLGTLSACLFLLEEKRMDLEMPVTKVFPEFGREKVKIVIYLPILPVCKPT